MKRLAALTLIMLFVVSSTGCRRGLRLFGMRGAPCQAGGPFAGGGPGVGMPGAQAPVMAAPVCCPPVQSYSPSIDCGCPIDGMPADGAYINSFSGGPSAMPGGLAATDGQEIPLSDTGFDIRPGETLASQGSASTAATAYGAMPRSLPGALPQQGSLPAASTQPKLQ